MQHRYQWAASHYGDRRTPCPRSRSFGACTQWPRAGCRATFRLASINLVTVQLSGGAPGWEGIRRARPAHRAIIITATPSPWAILSYLLNTKMPWTRIPKGKTSPLKGSSYTRTKTRAGPFHLVHAPRSVLQVSGNNKVSLLDKLKVVRRQNEETIIGPPPGPPR